MSLATFGANMIRRAWYWGHLLPRAPNCVFIETDYECNRSCSYCPRSLAPRPKSQLTTDEVLDIIVQLRKWAYIGSINWGLFNEPLLDQRIVSFMGMAQEALPFSRQVVWTNGDVLKTELLEKMLDRGLSKVVVSTHGDLERFKRSDWQWMLAKYGNIFSIKMINEGCKGLCNRASKMIALAPVPDYGPCYIAGNLNIMSDGSVRLCCNDYYTIPEMGNIRSGKSLRAIWGEYGYEIIRKNLQLGVRMINACKMCNYASPDNVTAAAFLKEDQL